MATETTTDAFLAKASKQVATLRDHRDTLARIVERYVRDLERANAKLEEAEGAVKFYQDLMTRTPQKVATSRRPEPSPERDIPPMRRGSYGDLVCQALIDAGGEATAIAITRTLQSEGKIPSQETAYNSVISALGRDPRFTKIGRGLFRLASLARPEATTAASSESNAATGEASPTSAVPE
jgi:hypothetical protein